MISIKDIQEILVLSGKGGSGKTFIASSLISLAGSCVACDYDVDASNLHLLFPSSIEEKQEYSGGQAAVIDPDMCLGCGLCEQFCQFEAIEERVVLPLQCEGCGLCAQVCPVDAVTLRPRNSGRWFKARRDKGAPLFYAELRPGEENSGKLVACLKDKARREAMVGKYSLLISDGPPGLGCSVISALTAVDLVVMVAEPSKSGIEDVKRLYRLLTKLSLQMVLLINKYDLNTGGSKRLEEWAAAEGIPLMGRIPFKSEIFDAISRGVNPITIPELRTMLIPIWLRLAEHVSITNLQ